MAKADILGPLAGRGEEHLRLRRMGIFLQEMMLHLPRIVVAELIGQFDLGKGVLIELALVVRFPGAGKLQLVENSEFHRVSPSICEPKPALPLA